MYVSLPFGSVVSRRFFCFKGLSSHSRIFLSYGDVTITGEGLQIWTYTRHSWPLSTEGSLACQTYCDTGHPFKIVIFEDPLHSHLLPSVEQWSCQYLFLRLRSVEFEHPTFRLWVQRCNPLRHHVGPITSTDRKLGFGF